METPALLSTIDEVISRLGVLLGSAHGGDTGTRELTSAELVEAVTRIEQAGRMVDALRAEVAHEVDSRTTKRKPEDPADSLAHSYGFSTSVALLKHLTLASGRTISRRIRVAKHGRNRSSLLGELLPGAFEHVGAAFFAGELHIDSADIITSELNKLPSTVDHEHLDLAERSLVSQATGTTLTPGAWEHEPERAGFATHADDIRVLTYGWTAALDQDGRLPREEQLSRRFFRMGEVSNGLVPIRGAIVPEIAASLGRMFDAINNPRTKQDDTGTKVRFEEVEPDSGQAELQTADPRTNDQKRHDALATIVNVAMKHTDVPQLGGEALSLTIQVTEHELTKAGGTAWVTDAHGQLAPLASASARHAACVGSVLRVLQDETGRIIELETSARVFNAHQRKAIMLRDGGCIIPGCTQSAIWCEIHHVQEWRDGGKTHTDNGVLLCWFHHRYLETHGWGIRMVDGVPQVRPPTWLDPEQRWRSARSVHRPPDLDQRPPHQIRRHETRRYPRPRAGVSLRA